MSKQVEPQKNGNDNLWTRPATIKAYREANAPSLYPEPAAPAPKVEDTAVELPRLDVQEGDKERGYKSRYFRPYAVDYEMHIGCRERQLLAEKTRTKELEQRLAIADGLLTDVPVNLFHQGMNAEKPSLPHPGWCGGCKLQKKIAAYLSQSKVSR